MTVAARGNVYQQSRDHLEHVPRSPTCRWHDFEFTLPQGHYSALAANANLCAKKLAMPTAFTAHNDLTIHQNTPIAITGCARHKTEGQTHKKKR